MLEARLAAEITVAHAQKRTRNGTVRWVARWQDAAGRERSKTFDTRRAADAHAHAAEAAAARAGVRRDLTVGQWLDEWLDDHVAPKVAAGRLAPKTAVGYESDVRIHLHPALGPIQLTDLRVTDVDQLLNRIIGSGRSPGTARSIRATLSVALTAAGRADLVDRNAAKLSEPPRLPAPQPSSFTSAEVDRILTAAGDHRLGTAIAFTLLTGVRASELAGLGWDDVDLERGTYTPSTTTHRIGSSAARVVPRTGLVDSYTKNAASGRRTPLPSLAVEVLADQRRRQATERLAAARWSDSGRVWTTTIGTRLDGGALRSALFEILDDADVPRHTDDGRSRALHELRRTWTERMRRAGVPVEDAARLGRWSSPATMMRHYAATPEDRLHDAAHHAEDGLQWGAS